MLTTTLLAETIMNEGAQKCGLSNEAIRQRNLIPSGYRTPYGQIVPKSHFPRIWDEGLAKSEYAKRREQVDLFNAGSRWTKRGLALIPTMYGGEQAAACKTDLLSRWAAFSHTDGAVFTVNFPVNMLNQIGAQVLVYTDGTVLVSHGGVEMGQGLVRDTSLMPASVDHVERLAVLCCRTPRWRRLRPKPSASASTRCTLAPPYERLDASSLEARVDGAH